MVKKKLLVAATNEVFEEISSALGGKYDCKHADSVVGAVEFLREHQEEGYQLIAQDRLRFTDMRWDRSSVSPELLPREVEPMKGGETIISYARTKGLINSDIPTFIATKISRGEYGCDEQSDAANVIFLSEGDLLAQMQPNLRGGEILRENRVR